MKFKRKIIPDSNYSSNFITKKRLYEDEIDFDQLRSYRLSRVKKELAKRDIGACILFDPVNIRYALDSVNMSIFNMHNLDRYCFIPVNGPVILFEYFNCEHLSKHLKLINEIRPGISWDYFSHISTSMFKNLNYSSSQANTTNNAINKSLLPRGINLEG